MNIDNTSITAHYLTVNSGDGILLDASGHTITASGEGATANFTAPNSITIKNADFSSFSTVNMAANTLVLYNVAFNGTVSLKSLLGMWNNLQGYEPGVAGYVNGYNVTYNNQSLNIPNGFSGTVSGTGLTIGAR